MGMEKKQRIKANEIFRKTMPFVWAKLLLGILTIVVSALILAILLGIAWLFKSEGVGLVMIIVWLSLTGIIRFVINHYIGFLVKAGHIAVITEAVTTGKVPAHQVAYGKKRVKERFVTANVYFLIDKLVGAAVRQIQRGIGKITGMMSSIPGMGAISSLAKFYVSISLGYIDECCLGYTFYKKGQSAFKSAADGVVIYSQNIKTLLAGAAITMLIVVFGLAGITLGLFLILGLLIRFLPLSDLIRTWIGGEAGIWIGDHIGFIGFLIALIIAVIIKYAFMDSYILIRTMVTYMGVAPKTTLRVDLYTKLCNISSKFKELLNNGKKEGKPKKASKPVKRAARPRSRG